jgi:uncharacterized membrane protein HdeD (DUF308 family)
MLDSIGLAMIQVPQGLIDNSGWFLAFGIVLASLGLFAVVGSFASTAVSIKLFGWLLLTASAVEFAGAFMVGHWTRFFLHLLAASLFMITGLVVLIRPVLNPDIATLVMSMVFMIGGLYQVVASLAIPLPGWGWQTFDGAIAAMMGVALLVDWPISGLKAIGLFLGIDLILSGCSWFVLAVDLGKI